MQSLLSLVFLFPFLKLEAAAVDMDLYQPSIEVESGFEGFLEE